MPTVHPLIVLAVGIAIVVSMIVGLRIHAFLALVTAAIIVSLLAPGDLGIKVSRVAGALGTTAGNIGIVIAMAAVIGRCMMDSGAADRIVRMFLGLLGERRSHVALTSSGFVLAVPVFFDTVFYLLVPLARSMYRRTARDYLKYVMAIAAGGAVTHSLVPPTPGPLVIAGTLGVDLGTMILLGLVVAAPASLAGLLYAAWLNRRMPVPMRAVGEGAEPEPLEDSALPPLWLSLCPIVLPVAMISCKTIARAVGGDELLVEAPALGLIGDANFALTLSAALAILVWIRQRRPDRVTFARTLENALMSGGVIILITSAGGAFGAMLQAADIGPAIQALFGGEGGLSQIGLLGFAFALASLLKFAQGSATVAMITAAAMVSSMVDGATLGFDPVYLALAIGAGSAVGSWMNDSGFWVFAKMSGLTEVETLKSWSVMLAVLGVVSMIVTVVLSLVLPLR